MLLAVFLPLIFWGTLIGLIFLGILNFLLGAGILFIIAGRYFHSNPQTYLYSSPAVKIARRKVPVHDKELQAWIKERNIRYADRFIALGIFALITWFLYGVVSQALSL